MPCLGARWDPGTGEATAHWARASFPPHNAGGHRMGSGAWCFGPDHMSPSHGDTRMGTLWGPCHPPGVPEQQGGGLATSLPCSKISR